MKTRLPIAALLVLALLAGCRSTKKIVEPEPPVAAEEEMPPAARRTYTVLQFTGTVEGLGAAGQMRIAEDSVMWVTVSKVVELGRAMATRDSVWLHMPLAGRYEAYDYAALSRMARMPLTFEMLQATALSDDAEERLAKLAAQLGVGATIKITQRRQVERLTFPFPKR